MNENKEKKEKKIAEKKENHERYEKEKVKCWKSIVKKKKKKMWRNKLSLGTGYGDGGKDAGGKNRGERERNSWVLSSSSSSLCSKSTPSS